LRTFERVFLFEELVLKKICISPRIPFQVEALYLERFGGALESFSNAT
jgi:hypothetical protein